MIKNIFIGFLTLSLISMVGLLVFVEEDVDTTAALSNNVATDMSVTKSNDARNAESIRKSNEIEKRVDGIESEISNLSGQVGQLTELIKNSLSKQSEGQADVSDEDSEQNSEEEELSADYTEESETELDELDPFSPESIARENEIQNRYVAQIDTLYQSESVDEEWATSVESEMLPALVDLDSFATQFPASGQEQGVPYNNLPDVSVSRFNCRSMLCDMEVIAGSSEEMIAYQNFMVQQTKRTLPAISFSTIEPYGNKFRMRAFLGNEEFEFPTPE